MQNYQYTKNQNSIGSTEFVATLFAIFICFYVIMTKISGEGIPDYPSILGTFGDFVGGILNPLIALLAFLWLKQSVTIQKNELSSARDIFHRQLFEQTFFNLLSGLESCRARAITNSHEIAEIFNEIRKSSNPFLAEERFRERISLIDEYIKKLVYILTFLKNTGSNQHVQFLKSTLGYDEMDIVAIASVLAIIGNGGTRMQYHNLRNLIAEYELLDSINTEFMYPYQEEIYSVIDRKAFGMIDIKLIPVLKQG